jgi:hypothetical protein
VLLCAFADTKKNIPAKITIRNKTIIDFPLYFNGMMPPLSY